MNYIFYPEKDASIYEESPSINTGLDQILEVSTYDAYSNRSLIKFNTNLIQNYITDNNIVDYSSSLKIYTVESRNIPFNFNIEILPISESWNNGTGKWQHNPSTVNGVSWKYKSENVLWSTGSISTNSTSSFFKVTGGSNWYNNYKVTQSFDYDTKDINVDIKPILEFWLDGTITNEGLLVKLEDSIERNENTNVGINFFSKETNTIFVPHILLSYDDSIYKTGSINPVNDVNKISVHPKIKDTYYHGEISKVEIFARDKYPKPVFSTTSSYLKNYRLPSSSYYSIIDNLSKNVIVDFSEYTKISHDNNINYFNLCVDYLFPKRTYLLKLKIEESGSIMYHTHKTPFFVYR